MATVPTLEELKAIIKEENLKIVVRKDDNPEDVLEKIKAKRAKLAGEESEGSESTGEGKKDAKPAATAAKKVKANPIAEYQKIIAEEGLNLRITGVMRKNPELIQASIDKRRKEMSK